MIIEKWQTTLGQTLYTKTFQPKEIFLQTQQFEKKVSEYQQASFYDDLGFQMQDKSGVTSMIQPQITNSKQQNDKTSNESKQFVINLVGISDLLGNPSFKTNITIGKVLKIIRSLIDGKETSTIIAKKYNVEQSFVEQIGKYVTYI